METTAAAQNSPDAAKHKRTASSVEAGVYTAAELGEFPPTNPYFVFLLSLHLLHTRRNLELIVI